MLVVSEVGLAHRADWAVSVELHRCRLLVEVPLDLVLVEVPLDLVLVRDQVSVLVRAALVAVWGRVCPVWEATVLVPVLVLALVRTA